MDLLSSLLGAADGPPRRPLDPEVERQRNKDAILGVVFGERAPEADRAFEYLSRDATGARVGAAGAIVLGALLIPRILS